MSHGATRMAAGTEPGPPSSRPVEGRAPTYAGPTAARPSRPDITRAARRLDRERRTIAQMIGLYCRGHGHPAVANGLCASCGGLLAYAGQRIQKCPFQEDKPTCARCPIHCYQPRMRELVRTVMRYAGPRMLLRHPWLTAMHYVDEWTRRQERRSRDTRKAAGTEPGPPGDGTVEGRAPPHRC